MEPGPSRTARLQDRSPEPAGCATALLDETEWQIHCGAPGCDAFLADASWVDVQMAMIMNSGDEWTARQAVDRLPPLHGRQFRMNVQFHPGWHKDDGDTWSVAPVPRRATGVGNLHETFTQRYIRGILRRAELSFEAAAPAKVSCPTCHLLQVIPRHYRRGVPPTVSERAA
jgi:hypothetical protein